METSRIDFAVAIEFASSPKVGQSCGIGNDGPQSDMGQESISKADVAAVVHLFGQAKTARRFLLNLSPGARERFIRAVQTSCGDDVLEDPLEKDPTVGPLIRQMGELAEKNIRAQAGGHLAFGSCHLVWREQQRLLRERFGIEWMSPATMNPMVMFD